jgi:hypothetical protein
MLRLTKYLLGQNKSLNLKNTIMVILMIKVMETGTDMLTMMDMVMETDTNMQKNMVMEMTMAMTTAMTTLTKIMMLTSAMMV